MSDNSTIDSMLRNHRADSFDEVTSSSVTDQSLSPLEQVQSEVDDTYVEHPEIAEVLPRDHVHCFVSEFKRLHGQCQYNQDEPNGDRVSGHHVLRVAEATVGTDEHDWRDTVRHELAHMLAYEDHGSRQKHNENWQAWARRVGASDDRCASTRHTDADYVAQCPNGCGEWLRYKRSKIVKLPWKYHCKNCGETIVSADVGDSIPDEPGTCAVDSIPWSNEDEWSELQ